MNNYKKYTIILGNFIRNFNEKVVQINIFNSMEKERKKYAYQCKEILKGQRNLFTFELDDLKEIQDSNLKDLAFFNTKRFLELLNSTLIEIINQFINDLTIKKGGKFFKKTHSAKEEESENYLQTGEINDFEINLIPPKIFPVEPLGSLNASLIGKFILIYGRCSSFQYNVIKLKIATYYCKSCGMRISSKISGSFFNPLLFCFSRICERKYNRKLFLDINSSFFQNLKIIKISNENNQAYFEDSAKDLQICLNNKTDQIFYPGDKIKCAGILLPGTNQSIVPKNICHEFLFQATFVEKFNYDYFEEIPFRIKKKDIFDMSNSFNLLEHISETLFPHFFGSSDLKKSLLLAMTSCVYQSRENLLNIREQINILLIGDFNFGKSSFLKNISDIFLDSIYIDPLNASLKNCLYSNSSSRDKDFIPQKIENRSYKNGPILIENLFFLKISDFFLLNKVLEKQLFRNGEVVITSPIIASLTESENFEIQQGQKKINLIKNNLFKKFDLVFFQNKHVNSDFEKRITTYLLEKYGTDKTSKKIEKSFENNFLFTYFRESRNLCPKFTEKTIEMIIYNYILVKARDTENFQKNFNYKFLISLIRISLGLAKLNFKDFVSSNDIKEASRLLISSNASVSSFKFSQMESTTLSSENKIYNLIRKISLKTKKMVLPLPYLSRISFSIGFSKESFAKCLEIYENLNIWAISLKQMKLVFLC